LHHEVVLAKAKPSLAAMIFVEGGIASYFSSDWLFS